MLDPAIEAFFAERKEAWLKKNTQSSMTESEIEGLRNECENLFSLENWLPAAAKRAGQMNISTHPCTFSHPSARKNKNGYVSSIIANTSRSPDGYLRSGNVDVELDALGNAAALDVYKFLSLILSDDKTLLEHITKNSAEAATLLSIKSESYETLKNGFLAMSNSGNSDYVTSSKIKQIYFPVDNAYHQLSILSNSGMIYELRKRIDALRFSDSVKEKRELKRQNQYSVEDYSEIYNITTIGYGGTKPQNISVLNNQNGGKAHLLMSVPPDLEKRNIRFPTRDFFTESIRYYNCEGSLKKLHGIFKTDAGGIIPLKNLKSGRDHRIEDILDTIIQRMWALRTVASRQYREETSRLPVYQRIWLCEEFEDRRAQEDDWLDKLCEEIAYWINDAYKKVVKKPVPLGKAERGYLREVIDTHREALR